LLDQPAMRALPAVRYLFTEFKLARVNIDYYLEYDKHSYSVPEWVFNFTGIRSANQFCTDIFKR
jgi:hypothetical protein